MGVIIKYVVERNGEEKMTFTSKADADAYDKMLDMADDLFALIASSELVEDETKREELSLFLAQNKEEVLYALGAKRRPAPRKQKESKPEIFTPVQDEAEVKDVSGDQIEVNEDDANTAAA